MPCPHAVPSGQVLPPVVVPPPEVPPIACGDRVRREPRVARAATGSRGSSGRRSRPRRAPARSAARRAASRGRRRPGTSASGRRSRWSPPRPAGRGPARRSASRRSASAPASAGSGPSGGSAARSCMSSGTLSSRARLASSSAVRRTWLTWTCRSLPLVLPDSSSSKNGLDDLVVGVDDDRARVAAVVLQRALLAAVEAALDAEDDQDQQQDADAERDELARARRLRVGHVRDRRRSRDRRRGAAARPGGGALCLRALARRRRRRTWGDWAPATGAGAQYDRADSSRAILQVCRQRRISCFRRQEGRLARGEGGRWCRPPTTRWRRPTCVARARRRSALDRYRLVAPPRRRARSASSGSRTTSAWTASSP